MLDCCFGCDREQQEFTSFTRKREHSVFEMIWRSFLLLALPFQDFFLARRRSTGILSVCLCQFNMAERRFTNRNGCYLISITALCCISSDTQTHSGCTLSLSFSITRPLLMHIHFCHVKRICLVNISPRCILRCVLRKQIWIFGWQQKMALRWNARLDSDFSWMVSSMDLRGRKHSVAGIYDWYLHISGFIAVEREWDCWKKMGKPQICSC